MPKNNFIILSVKKLILPLILCCFTLALVIFSKDNLAAAKSGISLWASSVLPALLPFFIATELLNHTSIIPFLGKSLNKFMRPIFNVPGVGSFAIIMGIISGYPVGAKIIANFRETNLCTKEEAERLLSFTNNSGPLFIIGTVGISLIGNTTIGIILLITHILASITVGIIFRFWKKKNLKEINLSNDSNVSSVSNVSRMSRVSRVSNVSRVARVEIGVVRATRRKHLSQRKRIIAATEIQHIVKHKL